MCFPFFSAQGHASATRCARPRTSTRPGGCSTRGGDKLRLPVDLVARPRASTPTPSARELDGVDVPDGWMGLDIGPRTAARLRGRDRRRRHGLLERPDGRVRARAVRRRHARGRRGGRGRAGHDGRRRRRQRRGAARSSASPTASTHLSTGGGASLELHRGQDAARSGGRCHEHVAHAVHRGQLEDAQDDRGGRGVRRRRCCRASRPPTASTSRSARRSRRCRPWSTRRAARASRSTRRTCTRRPTGAFTGEVSRADARASSTSTASCSATPSAASYFGETDRALSREGAGGARRRPEADPVRRRDRGASASAATPSASCATRSRRASRSSQTEQLGDVVDRLRADLGDRHRARRDARAGPGGDRVRPRARRPTATASRPSGRGSSTAAASSPTTRPSCSRCPTSTARSSAARRSRSTRSRRSSTPRRGRPLGPTCRPGGLPRRARRLGDRARPGRATRSRSPTRRSSTSCGSAIRTRRSPPGARPSACPRGRWATREVGHLNLGAGAVVKQDLTRIDEAVARRHAGRERRCCAPRCADAERVHLIGLVTDGGVHSGWRHLRGADRAWPPSSASPTSSSTRSPTGATRCPTSGAGYLETVERLVRARPAPAASAASSAATSRWTATSAGTASSRRTTCSSTAAPSTTPTAARGRARRLRARRDRRVHRPRRRSATRRASAPATASSRFNFRPDRMREITQALADPASTRSTAAAPSRSSATRR